jgi:hypothetical protein
MKLPMKDGNMKDKLSLHCLCVLACSSLIAPSFAQSKFEGFYGQMGLVYESIRPNLNYSGITISGVGTLPISYSIGNSNSWNGVATIGFLGSISEHFMLGIGAEYEPFMSKSASFIAPTLNSLNGSWYKQSSYNIFISPATPIGTDGLLYGKIGYAGQTLKDSGSGAPNTFNLVGYSLGLGYRQILNGGLYAYGEINYANLSASAVPFSGIYANGGRAWSYTNTVSTNTSNAVIGLGYKF